MKSGTYQFRKFTSIITSATKTEQLTLNKFKNNDDILTDIYLHRLGCTRVGVKFREPKPKKYGWKLKKFQVKVADVQNQDILSQTGNDKSKVKIQRWDKYRFSLDKGYKLKIKAGENVADKQGQDDKEDEKQQSQDADFNEENKQAKLITKALKIHKQISKILIKSQLSNNKAIQQWCFTPKNNRQLQFYVISKDKTKTGGNETATVSIQNLIYYPRQLQFSLECIEGSNKNVLLNKFLEWKCANVSYPQLLENLLTDSNSKDVKGTSQKVEGAGANQGGKF